jgi:hypothetical protein
MRRYYQAMVGWAVRQRVEADDHLTDDQREAKRWCERVEQSLRQPCLTRRREPGPSPQRAREAHLRSLVARFHAACGPLSIGRPPTYLQQQVITDQVLLVALAGVRMPDSWRFERVGRRRPRLMLLPVPAAAVPAAAASGARDTRARAGRRLRIANG